MDKCPTCNGCGKVVTEEDVSQLAEAVMKAYAEFVKQDELISGSDPCSTQARPRLREPTHSRRGG